MEETSEGLAAAAATREAAKRKREEVETPRNVSSAKKPVRPTPVLKHEVSVPPNFQESDRNLDQALHGATTRCV